MKKKLDQNRGFSLVEVTVALAIAALAIITFIGVLPSAMKDLGKSSDQSALGTLYEDVHNRLEGVVLEEKDDLQEFFYDKRGVFVEPDATIANIDEERYFKVNVSLKKSGTVARQINHDKFTSESGEEVFAVIVDVYWPLNESEEPVKAKPSDSITYYTAAKTGYNWINYGHEPKIEY